VKAMDKKLKIKIILGTIRENRFGERPAKWIYDELVKHEDIDVELLDLKEYPMPFFDSPTSPAWANKKYSNDMVQKWSGKIDEADAYIIVSPEYNHGYSSVLKNAIDWIAPEWYKKPVGFVGYGSVGGARVIEQLREVAIELKMVPINRSIHIPWEFMAKAMNNKDIKNEELFEPLKKSMVGDTLQLFIDDLMWMAKALKREREM
jgi:NAD(P)H-dependent FMN reductase